MHMNRVRLLKAEVTGIRNIFEEQFSIDFQTKKRVMSEEIEDDVVEQIIGKNYTNNIIALAGINVSGKTFPTDGVFLRNRWS